MVGILFKNNLTQEQIVKADSSRTETISYQTEYHKKKYSKRVVVYLPSEYKKNKKHNIIYLMHGSTEGTRDFYEDGNFKNILDKLSQKNTLKNTIVVFPTYYPSRKNIKSDYYEDDPLNERFAKKELVNDLMPVVEKKYRTYAENTTKQGFQKSRNHRAFGGFSMGAITTWYVFENDLKYFHYFLPMAGDSWTIEPDGGGVASTKTAKRLASKVQDQSFNIFSAVGANDGTSGSMEPQISAMWKLPEFNHQNLHYYVQKNGTHSPQSIGRQFEHYAKQLFKK